MKGFDVLKVKSAVKNHNKFDLSRTHLTTMDFGQIVPLFVEETVPGDKYNVSAEYFSRTAPLVKPTYGKFSFKTVSAFVPYHQIAVDAEAWLAGKTTWEGQTPHHRWFTVRSLDTFVRNNCIDTNLSATPQNADYSWKDTNGQDTYGRFSNAGHYWVKVLNALGYALPQGVDLRTTSTWYTDTSTAKLSAYPLLAFFKLYNDYMSQSQRFNTSIVSSTLNNIKYNNPISGTWVNTTGEILSGCLQILFANFFLNYENDYFTSAWQRANNPLNAVESVASVDVPGVSGSVTISNGTNSTYIGQTSSNYGTAISQRALDFLKSFDNWVRRNNYSGSRAVQQVYSRFGIKTDEYRSHYANVISTDTLPVQIGDVTSTSDTQGAFLGDYAGKAILSGNNGFSYEADDYGCLFILGYYTVAPMMAFGSDRRVLRSTPLDYYNPEFDGLGAEPISYGEVYASPIDTAQTWTNDKAVFGYTERYNSYRYGRDVITGDFRNYHPDGDMNTWHTGRNLSDIRALNNMVAQSSAMNTLPQTDSEYNRIFSVTTDSIDHFYMTARFKVNAVRPMLNLNQVVDLGQGDTAVPRNGNVIS